MEAAAAGFTFGGGTVGEEPVDVGLVAGQHTGAEAVPGVLEETGLEAMAAGELYEASRRRPAGVRRPPQAEPFRHHGVHPVASDQHLQRRDWSLVLILPISGFLGGLPSP